MTDEPATTKRKDGILDDVTDEALKAFDAQTTETQVSGIEYGADSAIAVNARDLQALVAHARKTGAEELAAKFPNL